ncbi:MAG: Chemotaxis response regulator protein-glutamate methylesterase CheB [Candidatus Kapaibacterium sp.]|nr:MAG: Chemotaxis response regulator protein-glutamate methylesterase CheB [Candidatus Kapabacteria bacterium]ROL56816.1 MAG: chemotaxis response regulator protein-glutamate methylesterase [Bacteroidetes/Chlorobi group bacterium Naka2016]
MNEKKIKLLIVDDSIFMRQALSKIFSQPDIEIVGLARNGKEAVQMAAELSPDVITMDIEMPVMNGLDALREIMKTNPTPVLMVSTLTSEGADATLEALSLGAVDFITKKSNFTEMGSLKDELLAKVRNIAHNSEVKNRLIRRRLLQKLQESQTRQGLSREATTDVSTKSEVQFKARPNPQDIDVVGIGISTGGPAALQEVFSQLPGDLPFPILIVQHMPPLFTKSLANRLNSLSKVNVKEAENMDILQNGWAYIAPGGLQMTVNKQGRIVISPEPNTLFKPSADVMFSSLAEVFGSHTVGIIMTGMGNDGTEGLRLISGKGGYVIAQAPDTCVVAGMPGSVISAKIANEIVPLKDIPQVISELGTNKR